MRIFFLLITVNLCLKRVDVFSVGQTKEKVSLTFLVYVECFEEIEFVNLDKFQNIMTTAFF